MKTKIYLLFFSLCFSLNLVAQEFPLDGKYSTLIIEDWTDGQWINSAKLTNTFDSNGNKIKDGFDEWNDTTKVWERITLSSHTLNANSTINYTLTQMWNEDANSWEDIQKTDFTYDAAKNILTQKMQMFFGVWMDMSLTTNTYNANSQLTKSVEQTSDFMTGNFANSTQYVYSYNANLTQNQTVSQNWNLATSDWEDDTRTTNTYNDSKKITAIIDEVYGLGAWNNDSKTMISYNTDGSMKEALYQSWNTSSRNWVDSEKEVYTNNPDGTMNQAIATAWMPDQGIWENQTRATFSYNPTSISQQLAGSVLIKVFPNPFTNVISIEYNSLNVSDIQLYNSNGQLVRTIGKGEALSSINLASLKNGVYMLKVTTPESQKVVKLLKQD